MTTNYSRMANKAANDYMCAVNAVCALKGIGNRKKIENLMHTINCMYQNQTVLIDEIVLSQNENDVNIEVPDFILRSV